jgi:adenylate kinase
MSVVGLFGVSGVGKSYFSANVMFGVSNFVCVKASDLIKFANGEVIYNKLNYANVQRNQQILSQEFATFRANHPDKNILIELHNVIETPESTEFLSGEVFEDIALTHAVFLQLASDKLYHQRLDDVSKMRRKTSAAELESLQERSKNLCLKTFLAREIPLLVLKSDDTNNLRKFLEFVS